MDDQHVIALDLGGTKLAAGVVDRNGVVLRRTQQQTNTASQVSLIPQLER